MSPKQDLHVHFEDTTVDGSICSIIYESGDEYNSDEEEEAMDSIDRVLGSMLTPQEYASLKNRYNQQQQEQLEREQQEKRLKNNGEDHHHDYDHEEDTAAAGRSYMMCGDCHANQDQDSQCYNEDDQEQQKDGEDEDGSVNSGRGPFTVSSGGSVASMESDVDSYGAEDEDNDDNGHHSSGCTHDEYHDSYYDDEDADANSYGSHSYDDDRHDRRCEDTVDTAEEKATADQTNITFEESYDGPSTLSASGSFRSLDSDGRGTITPPTPTRESNSSDSTKSDLENSPRLPTFTGSGRSSPSSYSSRRQQDHQHDTPRCNNQSSFSYEPKSSNGSDAKNTSRGRRHKKSLATGGGSKPSSSSPQKQKQQKSRYYEQSPVNDDDDFSDHCENHYSPCRESKSNKSTSSSRRSRGRHYKRSGGSSSSPQKYSHKHHHNSHHHKHHHHSDHHRNRHRDHDPSPATLSLSRHDRSASFESRSTYSRGSSSRKYHDSYQSNTSSPSRGSSPKSYNDSHLSSTSSPSRRFTSNSHHHDHDDYDYQHHHGHDKHKHHHDKHNGNHHKHDLHHKQQLISSKVASSKKRKSKSPSKSKSPRWSAVSEESSVVRTNYKPSTYAIPPPVAEAKSTTSSKSKSKSKGTSHHGHGYGHGHGTCDRDDNHNHDNHISNDNEESSPPGREPSPDISPPPTVNTNEAAVVATNYTPSTYAIPPPLPQQHPVTPPTTSTELTPSSLDENAIKGRLLRDPPTKEDEARQSSYGILPPITLDFSNISIDTPSERHFMKILQSMQEENSHLRSIVTEQTRVIETLTKSNGDLNLEYHEAAGMLQEAQHQVKELEEENKMMKCSMDMFMDSLTRNSFSSSARRPSSTCSSEGGRSTTSSQQSRSGSRGRETIRRLSGSSRNIRGRLGSELKRIKNVRLPKMRRHSQPQQPVSRPFDYDNDDDDHISFARAGNANAGNSSGPAAIRSPKRVYFKDDFLDDSERDEVTHSLSTDASVSTDSWSVSDQYASYSEWGNLV